jgi:hypothetical protein
MTKKTQRANACTIFAPFAVIQDMPEEIQILSHKKSIPKSAPIFDQHISTPSHPSTLLRV